LTSALLRSHVVLVLLVAAALVFDLLFLVAHSRLHGAVDAWLPGLAGLTWTNLLAVDAAVVWVCAWRLSPRLRHRVGQALGALEDEPRPRSGLSPRTLAGAGAFFAVYHLAVFAPSLFAPGAVFAGGDVLLYYLPSFDLPALWRADVFGGTPSCADPQAFHWYPPAALRAVPGGWETFSLWAHVVASTGAFALARRVAAGLVGPLAAGLVYGSSGFLMAHHGHTSIVHVAAWIPWLLVALHALSERSSPGRWVAVAASFALVLLAGHPQIAVYGLLLAGPWTLSLARRGAGGRTQVLLRAVCALTCGGLLAAIQLVPTAHLMKEFERSGAASLEFFASFALPLDHAFQLLFPYALDTEAGYVGAWNFPELCGYAGIVGLVPMLAAVGSCRDDQRARIWCLLAAAALINALGESTPFVHLAYRLPLLSWFRCLGRHLVELDLCVAILVALGVERLARVRVERHALAAGLLVLGALGLLVRAESWAPGVASWHRVWSGVTLAALGALVCVAWSRSPRPGPWAVAFLALAVVDLGTFARRTLVGLTSPADWLTCPDELEEVHADQAQRWGRYLALRGATGRRAEGIAEATRLWGLRSLGGYGPLMPRRMRVVHMSNEGTCPSTVLAPEHQGLDLLGVRFVGCAGRAARGAHGSLALWVPPGTRRLEVLSRLLSAEVVGETAGVLVLRRADHELGRVPWRPGRETSLWPGPITSERWVDELAWSGGSFPSRWPEAVIDLAPEMAADGLEVELRSSLRLGVLQVSRVTAVGERGRRTELLPGTCDIWTAPRFDPRRWRLASETPDVAVYENLRACPRAWLVGRSRAATEAQQQQAIQTGTLPGGERFDPRSTALVDVAASLVPADAGEEAASDVQVLRDEPGEAVLAVRTSRAGVLVLNEGHSAGWSCWVDGEERSPLLVDLALLGVQLEAGSHTVRFAFVPWSLVAGATLTGSSLGLCLWLLTVGRRRAARGA
jgi:hypothetical protein